MNKTGKFHRLMQILAMFLCVAMVAGTLGTANAAGGDNSPKITISVQPQSINYYNKNGENAHGNKFEPKFSFTAKIQNVAYQDGMKLIFNWQEKHAGSDAFEDSPLIVDEANPENTILSSQISRDPEVYGYVKEENVGSFWNPKYEYVWQNMNVSLPITSEDGKNVVRRGAIFRCNIILVDKDGNTICSVMTNEVKVNYEVRVTLHDGMQSQDIKVPYDTAVKIPDSYNREGYVTVWQTREGNNNYWGQETYTYTDFDITKGITEPVDLYVKRTKMVTVSFDMNGHGTQVAEQKLAAGQKATEPTKPTTNDGWEFVEWQDASGKKYDFNSPVNESITLKAVWKAATIEVTLYYGGHGYVSPRNAASYVNVAYGSKDGIPMDLVCKNPLTTESHKFLGWYTDASFKNRFVMPENGITAPITLYAQWGTYCTVSFKAGKNYTLANEIASQEVVKGGYATAPTVTPVATAEGCEFAGWYEDENFKKEFKFNQKQINANTVVYAKFVKKATVTVTLHANGHGNTDKIDTIYAGETYPVPASLTSNDTTHDTFLGWFTDPECTIAYVAKEINANLDLYAGWKTEYTVKFDANGKTFVGSYDDQKVVKGNSINLPENVTEDSDKYDFTGWTLNGESVSGNYTVNSDVTFVANWKDKTVYHRVTFVAREGNNETQPRHGFDDYTIQVEHGKLIDPSQIPEDPTCNVYNHKFGGWYTSIDLSTPFDFETMTITEDIKIYSGWFTGTTVELDAKYANKSYTQGDTLDLTNVKILIKQKRVNGNYIVTSEISVTADMVTNFDTVTKTAGNNKKVEVKYDGNTYSYTINVARKIINGSITLTDTEITKTYGDAPFAIAYTDATGAVTFESNNSEVAIVNEEGKIEIVGVGDATITVKVAANGNYTATEETVDLTVNPKQVSVTWTDTDLIYNGKEQAPKASLDGVVTGDEVNVTVSGAKKNVDNNYVATVSIDNTNYVLKEDESECTFSIAQKTVSLVWGSTELVYNGSAQAPAVRIADGELCENDTCEVTVTGKHTEVDDDYTAYASLSNENYALSADDSERDYVIAPKAIKLVWGNTEFVYNGEAQAPTVAVKDGELCGDDKVKVSLSGIGYFNVGIYTAEASIDNNNYVIADGFAKKDYTIAQAEIKEITIEIDKLICGTEISEKLPMVIAEDIDLTEDQSIQVIRLRTRRGASFDGVGDRLIAEPIETNRVSFGQDWNKVKLTVSDNVDYPAHFAILGNPLPNGLDGFTYFTGTVRGGKEYKAEFSMLLAGNYTVGENTKIVLKYGDEVLKADSIKVNPAIGTLNTLDITMSLLAEHVPGELEKDEDSVVDPTFEKEGSYDMVVKCTKCDEVLSRQSFSIAKLIPEVESITFSGFDKVKKAYLVGEDLDVTGLQYTVKMTDGTSETKDVTKDMVTGFSSAVENNALVLSLTYSGEAASYTVSVAEPAGEYVVEGDTKFNGKDNMKLHIIHTNAKRNAGLFAQFSGLDMDGKVVAKANYDATNGSIKLDIHSDYLKTLSEGEHNLTVEIGEDKVDVKITITKVQEEVTEPTQPAQQAATSDDAPSTGDTGSLVLWYVIALIALLSAAALAVARQKSRREEF